MRIASPGHLAFALTLIGIGLWSLIGGQLGAIWQSVPKDAPLQEALVYGSALVSLAAGVGLLWRRTAGPAAAAILVAMLVWLVLFKARFIVKHPLVMGSWENPAEHTVLVAAAWVLYGGLAKSFGAGETGVRIGRAIYALSMIVFGLAHFFYLNLTAPLVPAWLPAHTAWAYGTGAAYIAAGLAMLTGVLPRLAASLSALQMAGFTALVWVPMLVKGHVPPAQVIESTVSWALTAAGWVVADSYRGVGWLARGRR